MRHVFSFFFIFFFCSAASGQTDSLMKEIREFPGDKTEKIGLARAYLREAFAVNDLAAVNGFLGLLQNELDDDEYAGTLADERWLLYFWTENYPQLLSEVAGYKKLYNEKIQYQEPPVEDELFGMVDKACFKNRYELYGDIQKAFLSEEEKAFSTLLLDYLLRTTYDTKSKTDQDQKTENFIKKYPSSRFKYYITEYMMEERARDGKTGLSLDLLGNYGRNNGLMGVNFRPNYAFNMGLTYWNRKVNYAFRAQFGGQKVRRGFYDPDLADSPDSSTYRVFIAPDSSATVIELGLEVGYDVFSNKKMRFTPTIGAGYCFMLVPYESYSIENAGDLSFRSPYWTAALNMDFKAGKNNTPTGSFTGVRVRAGYKGVYLGNKNSSLTGNQLFVGVGLVFFGKSNKKVRY